MSRDTLWKELIDKNSGKKGFNEEKSPLIERNSKTGTNPFSCRKISACGPKVTVCGSFCHLREMVANKRGSMLDKSWQGEISTDTKPHLEKLMLEFLFQPFNKQSNWHHYKSTQNINNTMWCRSIYFICFVICFCEISRQAAVFEERSDLFKSWQKAKK